MARECGLHFLGLDFVQGARRDDKLAGTEFRRGDFPARPTGDRQGYDSDEQKSSLSPR